MASFVEDVFIGEAQGPVTRRSYTPFFFHIDFTGVSPNYFTDRTELIAEGRLKPSGLHRMDELHKLLERHVEDFVLEKTDSER